MADAAAPRGRRARSAARTQRAVAVPRQGAGRAARPESRFEGPVTYHDSCHLLRGLRESQSPRTLLRELAGARARRAGRARTSAAASGARSRCGCPRCPPPSSTRSSPTSRPPAPTCVVACDAGCLMQMGGGLSRRGSRVRALHLAEVLDRIGTPRERRRLLATPFRERATRALGDRLPPGSAHHRHHQVHRPPPGGLRRLSRRRGAARPGPGDQGSDAPAPRPAPRAARSTTSSGCGGHVHWAATAEDAREIVLDIARRAGRPAGREVQVDGHRGDRPQRGAGGTRG